ncbi:hypothetical protein ACFQH3_08950 [Haladaptatus sp. GCM10025707]|uniref:DUF7288 family protein n=1 Tax=unclassified Haladaptatus TaxID=2622732 RepID=UPI0023E7810B|nr:MULTISPECIES: hypothetical protein [unclassified Haladaptatus]
MRAQAHTLEGIVASFLLITGLVFALQATAVTPLSASTSSQHIENQERAIAEGVLAAALENGTLEVAPVFWDNRTDYLRFHNTSSRQYYVDNLQPNLTFTNMLERNFGDAGIAYNVNIVHMTETGAERERRLVYRGVPSDNAVTASRIVTLYDDDVLYDHEGNPTTYTVSKGADEGKFYMSDAAPESAVFNVVKIEVVVWRM